MRRKPDVATGHAVVAWLTSWKTNKEVWIQHFAELDFWAKIKVNHEAAYQNEKFM